ncbi:MAG TPA: heparan-alpha-glucosaminide N-acetyltransferase domain-containing protein [Planctomycetota bacterium]|nr:heparan-alpha-glucosaminide N-acetyltransferase domain-containing protein [Planctomycetota bacterium]
MVIPPRLRFVDLFRGLLMIHMALDHCSLFWNAHRFADEFWDRLPVPYDLPNFLARFTGFFVAPGFSFMAGFMVAVTDAARAGRGEPESAVRRRLLTRAGLLIAAETIFFSIAFRRWQVGVLTCLGACLFVTTFLRRAPTRWLLGAALAILALHPILLVLWTDRLDAPGIAIKLLHQAGKFGWLEVYYPIVPWIGVMLLGLVTGRGYVRRGARFWWKTAAFFAAAFLAFRLGHIGSAGRYDQVLSYSFFTWSKYPPDLPWLAASFAAIFALLAILDRWQSSPALVSAPAEFVATFGRVPFFFYLVHFAVLQVTSPREPRTLPVALAVWAALLLLLWWPCRAWFARRKRIRERIPSGAE